jgi:hypothetical protein
MSDNTQIKCIVISLDRVLSNVIQIQIGFDQLFILPLGYSVHLSLIGTNGKLYFALEY